LSDVKGLAGAKRVLEIAAAGGHSLLMVGPPGSGKSMLAQRFAGLLPPMNTEEALESAAIASLAGRFDLSRWAQRPTCQPHHSASAVALVGGGSPPRPGEISLAHHGVLFLDELPEFPRAALEALREPLETGSITIARAARRAEFPAQFQLIAAMNPCPCGYLGSVTRHCRCTPDQVSRYQGKLSGPLLDRIDLHIEVPSLPAQDLLHAAPGESTEAIAAAFSVPYGKADRLKAEAATHKYAKQLMHAMRPVFDDLLQEVQRSMGHYQSLHPDKPVTQVVGLGSTFRIPGLRKFLSDQLQVEIRRLEEFEKIKVEGSAASDFAANAMNLSTAIGLALQGLGFSEISINLSPVGSLREQVWGRKNKWFIAAACVAVVGSAAMGRAHPSLETAPSMTGTRRAWLFHSPLRGWPRNPPMPPPRRRLPHSAQRWPQWIRWRSRVHRALQPCAR
jgi:MoxR-like ATPase